MSGISFFVCSIFDEFLDVFLQPFSFEQKAESVMSKRAQESVAKEGSAVAKPWSCRREVSAQDTQADRKESLRSHSSQGHKASGEPDAI